MVDPERELADPNLIRFSTARRGFDQKEVRTFLDQLAAELRRLRGVEQGLLSRLDEAHRRLDESASTDPEYLTKLLGEEAARVLNAAREAAGERMTNAEASALSTLAAADQYAMQSRVDADTAPPWTV